MSTSAKSASQVTGAHARQVSREQKDVAEPSTRQIQRGMRRDDLDQQARGSRPFPLSIAMSCDVSFDNTAAHCHFSCVYDRYAQARQRIKEIESQVCQNEKQIQYAACALAFASPCVIAGKSMLECDISLNHMLRSLANQCWLDS